MCCCTSSRTCWRRRPDHGASWRHATRQVGLVRPRAKPDAYELADWQAISPAMSTVLQAIPPPTEPAPAEFFEDRHRLPCGAGYGTRGGTSRGQGSGSRYLKVVCRHPGCGYQVRGTRRWLEIGAPGVPLLVTGAWCRQKQPLAAGSARATPRVPSPTTGAGKKAWLATPGRWYGEQREG